MENASFRHVYALSIHLARDTVPFDVAAADYMEQIEAALTASNVRILGMIDPYPLWRCGRVLYRDQARFHRDRTPFLINPQRLACFWTGLGKSKTVRSVDYWWPLRCRLCKAEAHLAARCPWQEIEVG